MHDSHAISDHHDAVTRIYAEEIIHAFREQMREAERLAGELQDLLKTYESMVERDGATEHLETLVQWAESYSSELSAAGKMSRDGQAWLRSFSQALKAPDVGNDSELLRQFPAGIGTTTSPPQPRHFTGAARQVGKITQPVTEHKQRLFPIRRERVQS